MSRNSLQENNKPTVTGGVGFFGLMFLIFMTLKLCGVITWSWVLVTAPLWMPVAILGCILLGLVVWILVSAIVENFKK